MATLGANRYGKSRVRLSRITRFDDHNEFNEWTVNVMLYGDFEASYTEADNSKSPAHRHDEEHRVRGGAHVKGNDHRGIRQGARRLFSRQQYAGFQSERRD